LLSWLNEERPLNRFNETLSLQARETEAGSFSWPSPARSNKRNSNAKPARAARRAPQPGKKQGRAKTNPQTSKHPKTGKTCSAKTTAAERALTTKTRLPSPPPHQLQAQPPARAATLEKFRLQHVITF
jgi:hypothetical protein